MTFKIDMPLRLARRGFLPCGRGTCLPWVCWLGPAPRARPREAPSRVECSGGVPGCRTVQGAATAVPADSEVQVTLTCPKDARFFWNWSAEPGRHVQVRLGRGGAEPGTAGHRGHLRGPGPERAKPGLGPHRTGLLRSAAEPTPPLPCAPHGHGLEPPPVTPRGLCPPPIEGTRIMTSIAPPPSSRFAVAALALGSLLSWAASPRPAKATRARRTAKACRCPSAKG